MLWRIALALLITGRVLAESFSPSLERQKTLINMLKHDCGSCHGLNLKGGLGPALLPEALADKSNELLLGTIQEGRKGTAMPPWKKFISKQETVWLIEYLRR
jgi:cytochrome c55X